MFEFWKRKQKPSAPIGKVGINYSPLPRPLQDAINYPWGYQTSYSNKQGVNAWMGNQLPGQTNFIPDVPESYSQWFVQRNVQLAGNYVMNRGGNGTVGTMGSTSANNLTQQQAAYWQSLKTNSSYWGIWQTGD